MNAQRPRTRPRQSVHEKNIARLLGAIPALIALAAYLFYQLLHPSTPQLSGLNNGTHPFHPTTILISIDGFHPSYLSPDLTPNLHLLVTSGISARHLIPSFPSLTFPNHYTLVTGLYPESHGIVANTYYDPALNETFVSSKRHISYQSKWWEAAEPLWVTLEKQGVKTAVNAWPGSEAKIHGVDPTYLDRYEPFESVSRKFQHVLEWLDLEIEQRPQFIAVYIPDVDRTGHDFGPGSKEIRHAIRRADRDFGALMVGLDKRGLSGVANLVVVSDHGMTTLDQDLILQLDDLVDMSLIQRLDGWPLRGLWLVNEAADLGRIHANLSEAARQYGTFDVYFREDMPARWHFSDNPRIAPLWIIPKPGKLVIEKADFDMQEARQSGRLYHPKGIHGFDPEYESMHAVFIARGPAFGNKAGTVVAPFRNVDVYGVVCDSFGVSALPNNGSVDRSFKVQAPP